MARDILTIRDLGAHYHGIRALHSINLSVGEGSITAVIGPNGAGKSTLLNVVSGLVRSSSGSVEFQGGTINGKAGKPEDFAVGWRVSDTNVWGRPVGIAVGPDGALYITDDMKGMLYRIAANP